jgi:hypothetical protein
MPRRHWAKICSLFCSFAFSQCPDGPALQVGMTQRGAMQRLQGVAAQTNRKWVLLRSWRSRFAEKVEMLVHKQLR